MTFANIFLKLFLHFLVAVKFCQTIKTLSNPAADLLNRVCSCFPSNECRVSLSNVTYLYKEVNMQRCKIGNIEYRHCFFVLSMYLQYFGLVPLFQKKYFFVFVTGSSAGRSTSLIRISAGGRSSNIASLQKSRWQEKTPEYFCIIKDLFIEEKSLRWTGENRFQDTFKNYRLLT